MEKDVLVGDSVDLGWGRVYGGQSMAQACFAAHASCDSPERVVHSLSAYFPRPGNVDIPIEYRVSRLSDGGSLSTRRVDGYQNQTQMFTMSASLSSAAETTSSFEHRRPRFSSVHQFDPESVPTMQEQLEPFSSVFKTKRLKQTYVDRDGPFDFRPIDFQAPWDASIKEEGDASYYAKFRARVRGGPQRHVELLAYLSDWTFLTTALRHHPAPSAAVQIATISHHLFVHEPTKLKIDEFLYFKCAAPVATQGRAYVVGEYFDKHGTLLASVSQEGIMRPSLASQRSKGGGATKKKV